jgi:hypothetical protein
MAEVKSNLMTISLVYRFGDSNMALGRSSSWRESTVKAEYWNKDSISMMGSSFYELGMKPGWIIVSIEHDTTASTPNEARELIELDEKVRALIRETFPDFVWREDFEK